MSVNFTENFSARVWTHLQRRDSSDGGGLLFHVSGRLRVKFLEVLGQAPSRKVAIGIAAAAIECASFARTPLDNLALMPVATLGTKVAKPFQITLGMPALRIVAATDEFPIS